MGVASVAVYSDADRGSLHVRMADEAAHLGPAPSQESYLAIEKIIAAAQRHGAEAIHPGYGFLSENADFADACDSAGLVFIGPSGASIRRLGTKTSGRDVAMQAGVPIVPGLLKRIEALDEAETLAREIGYPIMLKAAAGGGGKGMRRVDGPADLAAAFRDASSEAERSFRNADFYLEKFIERPRHIEVQILGDRHGHMIHLGERECSIQRRHQKVIEECPSPYVMERPELREEMGQAAVRLAQAAGYYNAGTVEFLVNAQTGEFYFLEMNTRLQVEHPVTELVTGLDLVYWQLRIASRERLCVRQEDVRWTGSAIECRIGAEDPANQFFPSPGTITDLSFPSGPGIRLDSGIYPGWTVPMEYDSLLAKLVAWGPDRAAAISRLSRALQECHVGGIRTNIGFFRDVVRSAEFCSGALHTGFIEEFLAKPKTSSGDARADGMTDAELAAILAAVAHDRQTKTAATSGAAVDPGAEWLRDGRSRLLR